MQILSIQHDLCKLCQIVTCKVESPHRKSHCVTHCVKHKGHVQTLTIRHDLHESCRIVTCEVESSPQKSNRVRQDISHLEIIIPINVRGWVLVKVDGQGQEE